MILRGVFRSGVVVAVATAVAVAGCGGGGSGVDGEVDGTESGAVGGPGQSVDVIAVDNSFRAESLTVRAGTTVVWTNKGRSKHDIVPVDGSDSWGIALEQFASGDAYSHTFDESGTYAYYCTVHGTKTAGMVGVVVVE